MRAIFWFSLAFLLGGAAPAEAQGAIFASPVASMLVQVNGEITDSYQADRRLPPASLTKLMTAILVIQHGRLDEVVTVSRSAARETGSRLGLRRGDKVLAGNLFAAMLIKSANDACHALAEHVSGSEAEFVKLMNRKAREMALADTRFTNACGHDQSGHYSSAKDIARMAEEAMANRVIARLVGVIEAKVHTVDGGRTFHVSNSNHLIGRYPGAIGVKTGFTNGAGKCLVAMAERNGTRVLLVMLGAGERWWTAVDMLDAAFMRAGKDVTS